MAARLGNVLFVAALLIAVAWAALNYAVDGMTPALVMSAVVILIGWGLRYVLAGGKA